jgi:hypothetical protein
MKKANLMASFLFCSPNGAILGSIEGLCDFELSVYSSGERSRSWIDSDCSSNFIMRLPVAGTDQISNLLEGYELVVDL